jgi:hypothetical protein
MRTPDYYRDRAQEVRLLAEALSSPELREQMKMVAREYDHLAADAEALTRSSPKSPKG